MKPIAHLAAAFFLTWTFNVSAPASVRADFHPALIAVTSDTVEEKVVFNTATKKYHCATCTWAKRCTKNCITTTLTEAKAQGGVACKVCGGKCKETDSHA